MVRTVQESQHGLLESYDVVLVTDVDEIVAPDPGRGTLGDYIDRFDEEYVNCLGDEVLHLLDREPPLDLDRPCSTSAATGSPTTSTTSRCSPRSR